MIHDEKKEKTWHITAERSGGSTDEYFITAASLHEAFTHFTETIFPFSLAGISITEV